MSHDPNGTFGDLIITYDTVIDAAHDPRLFDRLVVQLTKEPSQNNDDNLAAIRLGDLGLLYQTRYSLTGAIADLDPTIQYFAAALNALPAGHSYTSGYQQSLAKSYNDRYEVLGALSDLDAALEYDQVSVDATPLDDPDLPTRQRNLAASYRDRYLRLGNVADSKISMKLNRASVEATLAGDPELPSRQQSLGVAYTDKYQREDNLEDLECAFHLYEAALEATSSDDTEYPTRLQALAVCYRDRYMALDDLSDLEYALKLDKAALAAAPSGYPRIALINHNLAISYGSRFRRRADPDDLESALYYAHGAVDATPAGSIYLPFRQETLGLLYQDRYHWYKKTRDAETEELETEEFEVEELETGSLETGDLEMGFGYIYAALENTPPGHSKLSERQHNLAQSLYWRFIKTKNFDDLEKALQLSLDAVNNTPSEHSEMSARVHNLAVFYSKKYTEFRDLADLYLSLKYHYRALALSTGKINHSLHLISLAKTCAHLFDKTQDPSDLQCALFYCKQATEAENTPPIILWNGARLWIKLAHKNILPECIEAYSIAFSTLSDLIWVGSSRDVQHNLLFKHKIAKTFSAAVTAAIYFGQLEKAVEFFEQGLAISHKQMLQLRDETVDLQSVHPDMANQLKELSSKLWYTTLSDVSPVGYGFSDLSQKSYHDIGLERKKLIKKIRTLPGFSDFFLPLSFKKTSTAAINGPVIMLNCSDKQCDAIILLNLSGLQHVKFSVTTISVRVQLDKLKLALEMCNITSREGDSSRFGRRFDKSPEKAKQLFKDVLSWLFVSVVQPVFKVLEKNSITTGRIWWCPSGPFTYLPIHAAATQSQFIHSYTLSLDMLIQARLKHSQFKQETSHGLAVIGVSNIADQPQMALPSVKHELQKICSAVKGHPITQLLDSNATRESVLAKIQNTAWVHLACHGEQNPLHPLKSGLHLHDGLLELGQILETNLPAAEFIFLSACQTAMGDEKLANESMHLAGGFIAAGFQGGIGTLWNMADSDGPQVAESVYKELFGAAEGADCRNAAKALHNAILTLRNGGAPFQRWIPFIHLGI